MSSLQETRFKELGKLVSVSSYSYQLYVIRTNELLLTEIIADRTIPDRQNLFIAYRMRYGRDLQADIRSDLSGKTERSESIAFDHAKGKL